MSQSRFNKELAAVDALKNRLAALRPLTATELNRLRKGKHIQLERYRGQ